MNNNFFVNLL